MKGDNKKVFISLAKPFKIEKESLMSNGGMNKGADKKKRLVAQGLLWPSLTKSKEFREETIVRGS